MGYHSDDLKPSKYNNFWDGVNLVLSASVVLGISWLMITSGNWIVALITAVPIIAIIWYAWWGQFRK